MHHREARIICCYIMRCVFVYSVNSLSLPLFCPIGSFEKLVRPWRLKTISNEPEVGALVEMSGELSRCVCMNLHDAVPTFWIQCDRCKSWYDAAGRCLGFSEEEAEYVGIWVCRGCPELDDEVNESSQLESQMSKLTLPPSFRDSLGRQSPYEGEALSQQSEHNFQSQDSQTQQSAVEKLDTEPGRNDHVFPKGDQVLVIEHCLAECQ